MGKWTAGDLQGELLVASGRHRGWMDELGNLIKALIAWAGVNNYDLHGPLREMHPVDRTAERPLVEMLLPIKARSFW